MKAKGYRRGGAPMGMKKPGNEIVRPGKKAPPATRAQRRSTLSRAQRNLLDSVQGAEGSKQATSVIQDLSDEYGFKPGKRAGAKGGMGGRRKAKPGGMNMGGVAMAPPGKKVPAMIKRPAASAPGTRTPSAQAQGGPGSARSLANLAAMTRGMNLGPNRPKPTKATAMRGAAARRSGGSTPRGMNMGGAAMKTKGYAKGGAAMKTKGSAKGGARKPSSKKSGLYGR